jgi:pimeloyl-ACP methyl ester carboxylesterase
MVVDVNDIALHYETFGDGEPLLWLHGFMGAGPDWTYIFKEPPEGYRLIAPDMRGHGASTNPSGAFSFRQSASDILALLRHLHVDRVKAIGLSGGGITLLHLATVDPSRVSSMVIVSAPPYFPEQARSIQRHASAAMIGDAELVMMRERHVYGESQVQQLFVQSRAFADNHDDVSFTPPHLATITAETLIVFGDRDPFYPVSMAFDLYQAIPRSYLWVVPNGGHGPVFHDAAPRFAETALSFLRGEWRVQSPEQRDGKQPTLA